MTQKKKENLEPPVPIGIGLKGDEAPGTKDEASGAKEHRVPVTGK